MTQTPVPPKIVAIVVLAVAALVVAFPLSVLGQGASRQSVFVAIPEVFPDVDPRVVIIRERGQDVVLLREDEATPEALAMSLVVLRRVREQHPRPENGQDSDRGVRAYVAHVGGLSSPPRRDAGSPGAPSRVDSGESRAG